MTNWKGTAVAGFAIFLACCGGAAGEREAASAPPAVDEAAEQAIAAAAEQAVAAANERLLDAYLKRDVERWLAGFSEDVIVMPPGAFMLVGRDALGEVIRTQFAWLEAYETAIEAEPLEIVVAGDWAYSRASFEVRHQPLDGREPIVERGRSLTIWQRQGDGDWLVSRHILNRPPQGPG